MHASLHGDLQFVVAAVSMCGMYRCPTGCDATSRLIVGIMLQIPFIILFLQ